jgi:hypothetical protein
MFTDGYPTDDTGHPTQAWRLTAETIRRRHEGKTLQSFAFGIPGANEQVLSALAPGGCHMLTELDFALLLKLILLATSAHDPYATMNARRNEMFGL